MNRKRSVCLVLVALLVSGLLRLGATPALAGPSSITNRISSAVVEDSGCATGTGWIHVTVITDSTPSGYNSVTAHAIGTPDTFIFDVPNGVSPYTHDIRFTAPQGQAFFGVELKLWWTDYTGTTLVQDAQYSIVCTGSVLPPGMASIHANPNACVDNSGQAAVRRPKIVPPCR